MGNESRGEMFHGLFAIYLLLCLLSELGGGAELQVLWRPREGGGLLPGAVSGGPRGRGALRVLHSGQHPAGHQVRPRLKATSNADKTLISQISWKLYRLIDPSGKHRFA